MKTDIAQQKNTEYDVNLIAILIVELKESGSDISTMRIKYKLTNITFKLKSLKNV